MVIWITGLSGAGKTTIGRAVFQKIRDINPAAIFLDGDLIREAISDQNIRHDRASRLVNANRISRLAKMFEEQGLAVVVSTMSLFHSVHAWNREFFSQYFEVLISTEISHLKNRDDKQIYRAAHEGLIKDVVGHDIEPELPVSPDLIIYNDYSMTPVDLAAQIFDRALDNGIS